MHPSQRQNKEQILLHMKRREQCVCTLLIKHKKKSFNMEHEDVIEVSTEATKYLINNDNDVSLYIAKLIPSVSNSGQFEVTSSVHFINFICLSD